MQKAQRRQVHPMRIKAIRIYPCQRDFLNWLQTIFPTSKGCEELSPSGTVGRNKVIRGRSVPA